MTIYFFAETLFEREIGQELKNPFRDFRGYFFNKRIAFVKILIKHWSIFLFADKIMPFCLAVCNVRFALHPVAHVIIFHEETIEIGLREQLCAAVDDSV